MRLIPVFINLITSRGRDFQSRGEPCYGAVGQTFLSAGQAGKPAPHARLRRAMLQTLTQLRCVDHE
jgi:hypothetical protein